MDVTIKQGKTKDAAKIIWESAQWLIEIGDLFWDLDEIKEENLVKKSPKENFFVAYVDNDPAAAMILDWEDPLFWPDVKKNTSGFVHKLSVAKKYKGKGIPEKLLKHAEKVCLEKGIHTIRLDCDPKRERLCNYYTKNGFILIEKRIHTLPDGRSGNVAYFIKSF